MSNDLKATPIGPFAAPGNWYRGALHVHTSNSDGADAPAVVLERYRALGYDFVAITDHQKVTRAPAPEGMLVLPGVEQHLSDDVSGKQWHFVGIGFEDEPRTSWTSPDEIVRFLRPRAAYLVAAHPYWSGLSGEDLHKFTQCDAVEVFNTLCAVEIARGSSEPIWDHLLSYKARLNCVAVDDTHQRRRRVDIGKAWVMVKATELTEDAILNALKQGDYYSSTGPEILDFNHLLGTYSVKSLPCRSVAFMCNTWYGRRFEAPVGGTLTEGDYTLQGREVYLRAQVTDHLGRRAWTNPVYF